MRATLWVIPLIAAAGTAACQADSRREFSFPDSETDLVIPSESPSVSLARVAATVGQAQLEYSVGEADSPPELVFGLPVDIEFDQHNHAMVLDRIGNNIRVLGSNGLPVFTFGRAGDGPNEFRSPVGMAFVRPDTLIVATRGGLKYFQMRDSLSFEFARMLPISDVPVPHSICSAATYLAIRALLTTSADSGIVAILRRPTGKASRIGLGYRSANPIAQNDLSLGPTACGDTAVTVAYTHLPIIRNYSLNGQLRWEARIADFDMLEFEEIEIDGRVGFGMRPGTSGNVVTSLVHLDSRYLLLQVARLEQSTAGEGLYTTSRATYVIDAQTGESAFGSTQLPHLARANANGDLATIDEDASGFVKITKYSLQAGHSQ